MIRKLHYCWFGGSVPDSVLANVERWKALNPEFELIEWNENNIDVSAFEFGRRCLEQKKGNYILNFSPTTHHLFSVLTYET